MRTLNKLLDLREDEENSFVKEIMSNWTVDPEYCEEVIGTTSFVDLMKSYESFFDDVIVGKYGNTAAYSLCVLHQ